MDDNENKVSDVVRAVSEVMDISDVTVGTKGAPAPDGTPVRIRGSLRLVSDKAYAHIDPLFRALGYLPVLRRDQDADRVTIVAQPFTSRRTEPQRLLAAALFLATMASCLFVGAQMVPEVATDGGINWRLLDGLPFAASLLVILAAHELGHYFVARHLGSPTSLPFFIPMPIGPFGTLGAVIVAGSPIRNRRHLLYIGAAGPLAGMALAIPIMLFGLSLSHIQALPASGFEMEGNSLLYAALKYLVFGRWLPGGGVDVFIHPVAFAAWAGLLVTGLNLFPVGQLDGGHIAYALLGPRLARWVGWVALGGLALLCAFVWREWWLWLALSFGFSWLQDRPLDELTVLTRSQKIFAAAMLVVFILVFTPAPLVFVP